jgi:hypothetical protein
MENSQTKSRLVVQKKRVVEELSEAELRTLIDAKFDENAMQSSNGSTTPE